MRVRIELATKPSPRTGHAAVPHGKSGKVPRRPPMGGPGYQKYAVAPRLGTEIVRRRLLARLLAGLATGGAR